MFCNEGKNPVFVIGQGAFAAGIRPQENTESDWHKATLATCDGVSLDVYHLVWGSLQTAWDVSIHSADTTVQGPFLLTPLARTCRVSVATAPRRTTKVSRTRDYGVSTGHRAGRDISLHTTSRERSRTSVIAAIVGKAGVAMRPVSILRSVSGETPAASATSSIDRDPRAARNRRPRRRPRSISTAVRGSLTMPLILVPVLYGRYSYRSEAKEAT